MHSNPMGRLPPGGRPIRMSASDSWDPTSAHRVNWPTGPGPNAPSRVPPRSRPPARHRPCSARAPSQRRIPVRTWSGTAGGQTARPPVLDGAYRERSPARVGASAPLPGQPGRRRAALATAPALRCRERPGRWPPRLRPTPRRPRVRASPTPPAPRPFPCQASTRPRPVPLPNAGQERDRQRGAKDPTSETLQHRGDEA